MMDILKRLDEYQYTHRPVGFIVAVVRRYGDDQAGRQAALITYYLFVSLFPLLLWLSYMSNWLNQYYPGVANSLIHGATNYFPVLGQQLFRMAHSEHRSIAGMIIPGLIALYGARGTALVFRSIVNDIWGVPEKDRVGFPQSWLRGVAIVLIGGGGFVLTAAATSWALAQGHGGLFRASITLASIVLLTGVFVAILRLSLPPSTHIRRVISGALSMSIALAILQLVGGYLVTHDLRHYTNTYTALFSTTLGLLAWIYVVSQVLLYSVEVAVVVDHRLWPIRIMENN